MSMIELEEDESALVVSDDGTFYLVLNADAESDAPISDSTVVVSAIANKMSDDAWLADTVDALYENLPSKSGALH